MQLAEKKNEKEEKAENIRPVLSGRLVLFHAWKQHEIIAWNPMGPRLGLHGIACCVDSGSSINHAKEKDKIKLLTDITFVCRKGRKF